ncbi:MAG: undecaprenyl/decaprenyl-phosphate alpha-N-acetylglucosaminyl 1-phosphate transferase [Bacteroidota bacterium]|nr:undecaprenyl/decaprenyl-phosphate alpha-N-acetylglucosaminyl 1-phosphate transferase [Bacteroidota bacterium]
MAVPVIIEIAKLKKLYDLPDERKIHTQPVPSLGGVGIFGGFLLAALLSISTYLNPEFQYFFAAAFVIFFLGLKDDLLVLSATKKFIGQVIAASIIIHLGGLRITSMHGLFGITELPEAFSLALTYLTVIVVINSFNLIDGVDGLAASLGLLTMMVFGIYFYAIDMQAYALLAFAMAGSLVAFLIFNNNPAKIFMGDSGSLMLGLVNAILVIKFITLADTAAVSFPITSSVAVGFAILIVPLLDTLRVFGIRIFSGCSPFTPDRNHVHHLMLDRGMSHTAVTLSCVGINILFIALAYFGRGWGSTYLITIMLTIAFAGLGMLYYRKPKTKILVTQHLTGNIKPEYISTSKVVTLTKEPVAAEQQ